MMHPLRACALLILSSCFSLTAQRTAFYADADALYKKGVELFDKKQYVSAQESFTEFALNTKSSELKADATYYAAACGIELFNKDSEWLMREFIKHYPASNRINSAYNYLATSAFRKKKYKDALEYYDKVDLYRLDKEELADLYFKRGYSFLQTSNDEKAKADFAEIKDVDNKYAFPANYYFSHIAYKEKNYEQALAGFNRLLNNESFGRAVPYYITQIYFIQGKYERVVQEAPKLLSDTTNIQKEAEINRMIGESYFNLKDYKKALDYLRKSSLNAQGNYVLGVCYYKLNDCTNAVTHFEKATGEKDSIAQSAWYHLGDCYIKLKDKIKAKNAFYGAYQSGADPKITEDALFSFAKLSYELDFNPYNESVKSFTKYLKEYPKSPRKDEVYQFLVTVYSTTKNYDQALKSIESLDRIDPILKVTYQKLLYFKGVEFFNNGNHTEAEKLFRKSLAQNTDMSLNALNQYWLADISYQRKDYSTAIEGWKKFQVTQGAVSLPEYQNSNYDLGYAYFHRKEKDDYSNANIAFRKYLLTNTNPQEQKTVDATIRTADCYFMNRDYIQASEYYNKAIQYNKFDIDYSLYQKALCDGLSRNFEQKVAELRKLETRFPNSIYIGAALNELADTYFKNLKQDENAIGYYEKILEKYPNSSYVNNSYAQLGNIYYNRKQDDKAFEYFDKFVKNDRRSEEAKEVLETIKKIFETKGDIDGMKAYFEGVGNPLSDNELEKASYTAAYDAYYNQKNCEEAMPKWQSYISKFPNGKYILEAQFNYAECAYSKNDFPSALEGYRFVISRSRSTFSEIALTKASQMLFKEKKYEEALPLYQQLEDIAETPANKTTGRIGTMRSAFYMGNYSLALDQCNKVLATEKLTPQQMSEARYMKARSLYETNRYDDALIELRAIIKTAKNATGAEAYYYVAKIQFNKGDYKEVEKTIGKLISYEYNNDDWNNKGMLLLADSYLARGDRPDAKLILETVLDSKPKAEYAEEATKKLEEIKAKEAEEKLKLNPPPASGPNNQEQNLQFNQNGNEGRLFEEEAETATPEKPLEPK